DALRVRAGGPRRAAARRRRARVCALRSCRRDARCAGLAAHAAAVPQALLDLMSARPSALDRACSEIAYLIQRTLRRQLRPAGRLAREVARLRQQGPRPEVAGLRYRLRRDGFEPALLAECFALYPTAVPSEALAAAAQLVAGGIVELADPAARRHALALAALARAVAGERVHLLVASDAAAQSLASELAPIFERLGLRVAALTREARGASRRELHGAPVLCAAHREVALD